MVISRETTWLEFSFPKFTLAVKRRMDLLSGELGNSRTPESSQGLRRGRLGRSPGVVMQGEVSMELGVGWGESAR